MNFKIMLNLALVAASFVAAGCTAPAKFSGKGQLAPSPVTTYSPSANAQFKLKANTCDQSNIKSTFEYSADTALFPLGGIKLEGEILPLADICSTGDSVNSYQCSQFTGFTVPGSTAMTAVIRYTSTNPNYPGTGHAFTLFVDGGKKKQGTNVDGMGIAVFPAALISASGEMLAPGPYANYANLAAIEKGNLKAKHCKDEKAPEVEIFSIQ